MRANDFTSLRRFRRDFFTRRASAGGNAAGSWLCLLRQKRHVPEGAYRMTQEEQYMSRAIRLARQGAGYTSPNPMVGCVVVKDGRIISEGYHERCGEYHAERNALLRCREDPAGADLYVTLEPCCHYGKTPPCTEIILEKKIGHVYVGSMDSNPLVAGKGVQILRDHGIPVTTGILEEECLKLNEVFYHFITHGTPYVAAKYAMTLDGKIACASGDSKWVTNESSRQDVQQLRKLYSGIMVGIGTVLADDPMLNCRIAEGADPVRIVCDSSLRIPMEAKLVQTAREIPTIVAAGADAINQKKEKAEQLTRAGVEVLCAGQTRPDLKELMRQLGEKKIDSVLIEGGGTLNASAFEAGIVRKVYVYIAGKIAGGKDAPTPVRGRGVERMADALALSDLEVSLLDGDLRVVGYLKEKQ